MSEINIVNPLESNDEVFSYAIKNGFQVGEEIECFTEIDGYTYRVGDKFKIIEAVAENGKIYAYIIQNKYGSTNFLNRAICGFRLARPSDEFFIDQLYKEGENS